MSASIHGCLVCVLVPSHVGDISCNRNDGFRLTCRSSNWIKAHKKRSLVFLDPLDSDSGDVTLRHAAINHRLRELGEYPISRHRPDWLTDEVGWRTLPVTGMGLVSEKIAVARVDDDQAIG